MEKIEFWKDKDKQIVDPSLFSIQAEAFARKMADDHEYSRRKFNKRTQIRKFFDEVIVNIGRQPGSSLEDIAHYVERDSTYGWLHGYLHGHRAEPVVRDLDEESGSMLIDGVKVSFLRSNRNPAEIGWGDHGVRLVLDTTGQFLDPTPEPDNPRGGLRGHFDAGAEKIIIYFKHNSNDLPDKAFQTLDRIAVAIVENPDINISIKGYTDSTGELSYNMSISNFRANIIKSYLVGKGVRSSRITAVGLGPENPIASNDTAEGRRQNRRVELEFSTE